MTEEELKKILDEFRVPKHVRRHCDTVTDFALKLAVKLQEAGEKIDLNLLKNAGRIHDLVRVIDFKDFTPETFPDPVTPEQVEYWKKLREKYSGRHHADVGADILEQRGFPEIAKLVRKHRYMQIIDGLESWEEKLLYYADKRTKHGKIVPLKERLDEGQRRNAPSTIGTEASKKIHEKIFALEKEILTKVGSEI